MTDSRASTETPRRLAAALIADGGSYARRAGIRLADTPAPLWQLLVLSNLVSARIQADIAVTGAASLFEHGGTTPKGTAGMSWNQRKHALVQGRYHHYADGTATRLGECARQVLDDYRGDLRRLADEAEHDPGRVRKLLQQFPGIGPAGAEAFCREAQSVWPWLRPVFGDRALAGAGAVGLPEDAGRLAALVDGDDLHRLADALVRVGLDPGLAERVRTEAAGSGS